MLDRDPAVMYGVETRTLNQAVKRNGDRFPEDFMFQLTDEEVANWKSQIVMSNSVKMGMRRNPYAFTELGVAMLSSVLTSKTAIQVNMGIMRAFVAMRKMVTANPVALRLSTLEKNFEELKQDLEEILPTIMTSTRIHVFSWKLSTRLSLTYRLTGRKLPRIGA